MSEEEEKNEHGLAKTHFQNYMILGTTEFYGT